MKPVTQSRTGETGTCFRACIASLLGLKESQVPDWPEANQDPDVNKWLAKRGLRYEEVPVPNRGMRPAGDYIALGTSPRGGQHAVIMSDGKLIHDPHPQDGTGRGLVKVRHWGMLLPTAHDSFFTSRLDRYPMEQLLDTLGIDIKEFLRRSVVQRERLLDTAIKELDRKTGRAKDMNASEKERRTASTYRTQLQNRAAGSLQEAKLLRKEGNTARAEKFEAQAAKHAAEARKSDAELAVLAKNAAQGRDSDPRDGVTKCQACGVGLMGDDVAERGGKVICPECADSGVRKARAKDAILTPTQQKVLTEYQALPHRVAILYPRKGLISISGSAYPIDKAVELMKQSIAKEPERLKYVEEMKNRVRDDGFKPGDHVVIRGGYGGRGGEFGQDFKRFSSDTPAVVTNVVGGGNIWVRPEDSKWKYVVQVKALVEGSPKPTLDRARAKDAQRFKKGDRVVIEGQRGTLKGFSGGGWVVKLDDMRVLYGVPTASLDSLLTVKEKAKDTAYSEAQKKYVDGPNSDGEFSAGVSGPGGTAQHGGFKTRKEAEAWIAKMLPKVSKKPALDRSRAKDAGACLTCGKPATKGEHFCSASCEEQWIAKKFPRDWADMKKRGGKPALDRARLHRALDAVMDSEEKPVWKQIDETEVRIRKIINEYGRSNSKLPALQKKLKMLRASKVGN